jgi:hypothetical protein
MADAPYDIAVIGSGALPGLVAGLLALLHGKRVVLVAPTPSPYRLPRGLDLTLWPVTRPDSFALIERGTSETLKLVGLIGKGLVERRDLVVLADSAEGTRALSHFRHLARLAGFAAEPMREAGRRPVAGTRIRDIQSLSAERFGPALADWLAKSGVRLLDQRETIVSVKRDGSCRLTFGGLTTEAADTVLVGEDALATLLPEEARDPLLQLVPRTAILSPRPRAALQGGIVTFPDRGVTLADLGKAGVVSFADGSPADAGARIGASLPSGAPLPRLAEARFDTLASRDGAAVFATARGGRARYMAGLGPTGAMLAPMIARWLMGTSTVDEAAWFSAHGPSKGTPRLDVAEYRPLGLGASESREVLSA